MKFQDYLEARGPVQQPRSVVDSKRYPNGYVPLDQFPKGSWKTDTRLVVDVWIFKYVYSIDVTHTMVVHIACYNLFLHKKHTL